MVYKLTMACVAVNITNRVFRCPKGTIHTVPASPHIFTMMFLVWVQELSTPARNLFLASNILFYLVFLGAGDCPHRACEFARALSIRADASQEVFRPGACI
jgi:hypothetical protein